jgi:hypothetical protein
MSRRSGLLSLGLAVGFVWALSAQDTARQLTARELFYSATEAPAAQAAPAQQAAKKAPPGKRAAPPKAPEVAAATPSETAPVRTAETAPARDRSTAPPQQGASLPDGGRMVETAAAVPARATAPPPSEGLALGLKYSIRRSGQSVDIAPDTVFHAGDGIQFYVETNGPGYLYIISQGSSGTWKPMFPSPEVENGDNHVDGFRSYTMPPGARITFDEQTGTEKVFIVFSREPEPDLESVIYSLQAKPAPASAPVERQEPKQLLMASNLNIQDSMVGRLRTTYARDLVIEKVDPSTAGERKEYAVYVVNPSGSPDSRVVADLQLAHQ